MAKTYQSLGLLAAAAAAAAGVLVAVGVLVLTMLLVVDEPAGAAFPGQNGKIAFTSNRDGDSEIYTMNPNGQGVDRLTNNPKNDFEPAWSADGNKIAFYSTRDGNDEIYTMNPNGQGLDRLTNNTQGDYEPDWQPLSPAPNPTPPNNTTAPKVLSISPKANAPRVAPTASLKATFSEKMQPASLKSA